VDGITFLCRSVPDQLDPINLTPTRSLLDHTPAESVGNKSRTSPTMQWSSSEELGRDGRVDLIGSRNPPLLLVDRVDPRVEWGFLDRLAGWVADWKY